MEKLVSVVIPTYGRSKTLDTAIKSVMQQSYKNIEIIVVDDNAAESQERIFTEEMMQKYKNVDQVRYCKHQVNKGGCAARNTGIKNARGEYIAFLDDDDRYLQSYIEKMVQRIEKTYSDMVYMSRAYCDDGKNVYTSKMSGIGYPEGNVFEDILEGKCSICIFFLTKKSFLEKIGMFDEDLKGFQDCDVWFGLAKIGKLAVMNDAEAVYSRDSSEHMSINPYKREKALETFEQKWLKKLNDKEQQKFQKFVLFHKNQIEINKVFWNLLKGGEGYISSRECLKIDVSKSIKINLILVKLLGNKGDILYNWLRFHLYKNKFIFLEG